MNKTADVTTIRLRSRSAIAKAFSPDSKKRKEADANLFSTKPVKMYGKLLVSRGGPANGRRKRTKVVDMFSPWSEVVRLKKLGFRVLVKGYPNTVEIRKFVPFVA